MKAADFDFHTAVVELAGHARLSEHYRMLHGQTRLYLNLTATVGYQPTRSRPCTRSWRRRSAPAMRAWPSGSAARTTPRRGALVALLGQATGC